MRLTQDGDVRTSALLTAQTFKHICQLPLVHRPKGVLLEVLLEWSRGMILHHYAFKNQCIFPAFSIWFHIFIFMARLGVLGCPWHNMWLSRAQKILRGIPCSLRFTPVYMIILRVISLVCPTKPIATYYSSKIWFDLSCYLRPYH